MYEDEFVSPRASPVSHAWAGLVARAPATVADDLYVTLDGVDDGKHLWGPCRWSPRPTGSGIDLPEVDDKVLVVFDDDRQAWVVEWWPYA